MSLANVEAGSLEVASEHVGAFEEYMTFSWHDVDGHTLTSEETAFTLAFTAGQAGRLSDQLRLISGVTAGEAYLTSGDELEVADVVLEVDAMQQPQPTDIGEFVLYQNRPNPFRETTHIGFSLPAPMHVTLSIYSGTGQLLLTREMDATAGYTEFVVHARELPKQTVLYYKVDASVLGAVPAVDPSASYSATKKMIIVE